MNVFALHHVMVLWRPCTGEPALSNTHSLPVALSFLITHGAVADGFVNTSFYPSPNYFLRMHSQKRNHQVTAHPFFWNPISFWKGSNLQPYQGCV